MLKLISILICLFLAIPSNCYETEEGISTKNFASLESLDKSLEDLLSHCCRTQDGIERDCCRLVYPNVPESSLSCSCPNTNGNKKTSRNHFDHFDQSQFVSFPNFSPFVFNQAGSGSGSGLGVNSGSQECHPMTKNIAIPTQKLLHRCCYVPTGVALSVGLDCLALAFPIIPKAQRCGECTTPGTLQDLYYECCNADDKIQRDCCTILAPFNQGQAKRAYCPCPKKSRKDQNKDDQGRLNPESRFSSELSSNEEGRNIQNNPDTFSSNEEDRNIQNDQDTFSSGEVNSNGNRNDNGNNGNGNDNNGNGNDNNGNGNFNNNFNNNKCHPSTQRISMKTQRILNKCCLTNQMLGLNPPVDCLALAFPSLPWNERCGSCDSDMTPKDLLNECCGTRDGIPRDCCQLVFPKIPQNKRFCPCRATGSTAQRVYIEPEQKLQVDYSNFPQRRQSQINSHQFSFFNSAPATLGVYGVRGARFGPQGNGFQGFNGIYSLRGLGVGMGGNGGAGTCPIQSPEPAVNLHTFCCNTHGKKELGFTCERIVLGREPDHGNRPCGAWSNTLDAKQPTVQGNPDYLDYEDY